MRYDFDEIVSRRESNSVKWDSTADDGVLPMWVADMDFRAASAITEALRRRVEHGIFGYTRVPDSYYKSIIAADTAGRSRKTGFSTLQEWFPPYRPSSRP